MSEEQSFLDALKASPFDDTTRLVYADWLDEHSMPLEAEYLRLAVALVPLCNEDESTEGRRLLKLTEALPVEWRDAVGGRFTTVLYNFDPHEKIAVIKLIRETTGCGLREAKDLSEALPSRVVMNVPYERAVEVREYVRHEPSAVVIVHPADTPAERLPFRMLFRVVAGFAYWGEKGVPARQAEQAFRQFIQSEMNVSADRAGELCRGPVVMADGLSSAEATALANQLRERISVRHAGPRPEGPLFAYVCAIPSTLVPNESPAAEPPP